MDFIHIESRTLLFVQELIKKNYIQSQTKYRFLLHTSGDRSGSKTIFQRNCSRGM